MVLNGLRIVESEHLVEGPFEDWSRVRSPGRARRRRRRGFRQNIRIYYRPSMRFLKTPDGVMYGHPAAVAALIARLGVQPQGW